MAKQPQKPPEKKSETPPAQDPALTTQEAARIEHVRMLAGAEQGALDALQERIDVLDRQDVPLSESKLGPTADAATESLLADLIAVLSNHAGERGDNEGAVETLKRIIRERDALRLDREDIGDVNHVLTFGAKMPPTGSRSEGARLRDLVAKVKSLEAQLQPAHNIFGLKGTARGVIISHVKGSGPSYDVGGKYRLALVTVKDGEVVISETADVVAGVASHELPFGLVRDHLEKRLEDYLTPEAHRS